MGISEKSVSVSIEKIEETESGVPGRRLGPAMNNILVIGFHHPSTKNYCEPDFVKIVTKLSKRHKKGHISIGF